MKAFGSAVLAVLIGASVWWLAVRPSNDRQWVPEQAVMPSARFDGHLVEIRGIRNISVPPSGRPMLAYSERTFDLDKLGTAWFIVAPLAPGWRGPAHTFVSFGFADSQFVAISVEARREVGEEYSIPAGLLRRYELLYVIGDEHDLIRWRAVNSDADVYLYPIRASPQRIRAVFVDMLERANALRSEPEFYNTLTNNCTSNVVRHVNRIVPHEVPRGVATILPGYADRVAYSLGLIDTDGSLAEARRRFRINDRARRYANDPQFSLRIREAER